MLISQSSRLVLSLVPYLAPESPPLHFSLWPTLFYPRPQTLAEQYRKQLKTLWENYDDNFKDAFTFAKTLTSAASVSPGEKSTMVSEWLTSVHARHLLHPH